jgi:hypothetical protein
MVRDALPFHFSVIVFGFLFIGLLSGVGFGWQF